MSSIYTPDLSGLEWSYYVSNYQRTIFRYPQKVLFDVPIFRNERLSVVKLGVVNVPISEGVEYVINEDDIDYDAISVCKNIDNNFDGTLLKSITIIAYSDTPFKVQISYNQLFADSINYAQINQAQEIEVTPILIANMVEQITYLQQMVLKNSGEYSEQSEIVKSALNEYPNGDNDENLIINELHDIDTINGKCFIRTIYGSFFKDSVVIKNELSGQIFNPDQDYIVLDLDITRTKITSNPSGVYRVIKILKEMVGSVSVNYRAYGGVADIASMRYVQNRVNVIEDHLSHTSFITPRTLPADPTITGIKNKLQEIEGTMRLLLQNGLPSYGDVSTGTALLKKVVAQDTNVHWWSIATLYRVEGSVDNILADVFKFRLKSVFSGLMFECSVSVNVVESSPRRLSVVCDNSNVPEDVLAKFTPKLRIIEVAAGGVYSGVVLQLGMRLSSGILQETFDIEDMSGRESCWKLIPFVAASTPPEDTGVLMPNGVSIFSYGETAAVVNEVVIPFKDGLNIMNLESNIPLQLGDINSGTIGYTINQDLIVQNLGDVDFNEANFFKIKALANIAENDEREIIFMIPITAKDKAGKFWSGYCRSLDMGFAQYNFAFSLWYDDVYKVKFGISASIQSITLNVIGISLMF